MVILNSQDYILKIKNSIMILVNLAELESLKEDYKLQDVLILFLSILV